VGKGFLEQLQLLRRELGLQTHPRDVAARSGEAGDLAGPDRLAAGHEDNGNGRRRSPGRIGFRRRRRDDDIDLEADQLGGKSG
jgi:hypothetical protein